MYKYLFGPVPSRRLGLSLGVDLVPKKTCSFDCVYCEAGKTTNLTVTRKCYSDLNEVKKELAQYFEKNSDPDFVTFSGYGEPTLDKNIKEVILFIKKMRPDIKVAVLTNGSLFNEKGVIDALYYADLVIPSLDAATEDTFKKINRPHKDIDVNSYIEGLIKFRNNYMGKFHLEVFVLPGFNDNIKDLHALKNAIEKIRPDLIQLNSLDRPGVKRGIRPATYEELHNIIEIWGFKNVEIISSHALKNIKNRGNIEDIETSIIDTIKRRPCTIDDLTKILNKNDIEIKKYLDKLEKENKISLEKLERGIFYKSLI